MRDTLDKQLATMFPAQLVGGLLDSYEDMKRAYLEGRDRPSELEAGHFAEWAFRICEVECTGKHTTVGRPLGRMDKLVERLASAGQGHDSFKLHIPRVLFGVYDARNRRGVGHPSGDVNPNRADAELLVTAGSWVVAEMLRHAYSTDLETAQQMVDELVKRRVPIVEEIDGFPRILRTTLSARDRVLVLLLHFGEPTTTGDLRKFLRTVSGKRLVQVLRDLDREALLHETAAGWVLTSLGVERGEEVIAADEAA